MVKQGKRQLEVPGDEEEAAFPRGGGTTPGQPNTSLKDSPGSPGYELDDTDGISRHGKRRKGSIMTSDNLFNSEVFGSKAPKYVELLKYKVCLIQISEDAIFTLFSFTKGLHILPTIRGWR